MKGRKVHMDNHEKIVFLDIDGVMQAYNSDGRFKNLKTIPELQKELTSKYGVDYTKYDKYDVGAVYYDWHPKAVSFIRKILQETGAMVVISSDWRDEGLDRMIDFFRLHDMGEYVVDLTPRIGYEERKLLKDKYQDGVSYRTMEILEYVEKHPHIQRYVAIDDMDLSKGLEGHFVKTSNLIKEAECKKAIGILNGTEIASDSSELSHDTDDDAEDWDE